MVEVLDAQVDWREGYGNPPDLEVLLDEVPDMEDARFQARIFENGRGLYYSDQEGYVRYYTWSGDGNDGGYSGRHYNITLTNGVEVTLLGPYSSRAGVMNKYDLGPCVDVNICTDPDTLERGYTFTSGALSLELAEEAAEMAGVTLHLDPDNDEPVYRVMENHPTEWTPWNAGASDILKRFKLDEDEKAEIVVRETDGSPYPTGKLLYNNEVIDSMQPNMVSPMASAIKLMERWNNDEVEKGDKPKN